MLESFLDKNFIYRNGTKIESFCLSDSKKVICVKNKIFIWDSLKRKIQMKVNTNNTFFSCLFLDNELILRSKEKIVHYNGDFHEVMDISSFSNFIERNKSLIIFDENDVLEKKGIEGFEGNSKKIYSFEEKNGICTSIISHGESVFCSYENGNIYRIVFKSNSNDINEVSLFCRLNESIISMDVNDKYIVIALFLNKIIILEHKNNKKVVIDQNTKYTCFKNQNKKVLFHSDFIMLVDSSNNLIILNYDLKILAWKEFDDNITDIKSFDGYFYISFGDGRLFEYKNKQL